MRITAPYQGMDNLLQHQSVSRVLRGNLSQGNPTSFDSSGVPTAYEQDNMTGNLFRHTFTTTNADEVITHNLGRVPVGYYLTRKGAAVDVYDGTLSGWTESEITLRATVAADTTIYIF